MNRKQLNAIQESIEKRGSMSRNKTKWRTIVKEMGARKISLNDIKEAKKLPGMAEMLNNIPDMTYDDLIILRQYAEGIYGKYPTTQATFLRDTAGEKPSSKIEITEHKSVFDDLTEEQIEQYVAALSDNDNDDDDQDDKTDEE